MKKITVAKSPFKNNGINYAVGDEVDPNALKGVKKKDLEKAGLIGETSIKTQAELDAEVKAKEKADKEAAEKAEKKAKATQE